MRRLFILLAAMHVGVLSNGLAQTAPPLINYQGQIQNPDGSPVPTADYELSFNIYDSAQAGTLIWGPQTFNGQSGPGFGPKIPVVQGYFNVMLGPADAAGRQLSGGFNGANRYLEITVSNRTPIAPRQQMVSTPFAFSAINANNAALAQNAVTANNALNANSLGGTAATDVLSSVVPIGAIVPFYGNPSSLPANWKLCDGRIVNDPASPFNLTVLPDLREMFLRGASSVWPLGSTGGNDSISSHTHFFSGSGSVFIGTRGLNGWNGWQIASRATEFSPNIYALTLDNNLGPTAQDTHGHSGSANVSGTTGSGGSGDNRPRFYSLHFIIRIK